MFMNFEKKKMNEMHTLLYRMTTHLQVRETAGYILDEKVREIHEKLSKSMKSQIKMKLFCKCVRKC